MIGSDAGSVACSEADPAYGGTSFLPSRQASIAAEASDNLPRLPLVPAPPVAPSAADAPLRHSTGAASRPGSAAGDDAHGTLLPRGPSLAASDKSQPSSTATSRRAQPGAGGSTDAAHRPRESGVLTEHALRLELSNLVQHLAVFKDKAAELETENAGLKARLGDSGGQVRPVDPPWVSLGLAGLTAAACTSADPVHSAEPALLLRCIPSPGPPAACMQPSRACIDSKAPVARMQELRRGLPALEPARPSHARPSHPRPHTIMLLTSTGDHTSEPLRDVRSPVWHRSGSMLTVCACRTLTGCWSRR